MPGQGNVAAFTTEHERMDALLNSATSIKKILAAVLDSIRPSNPEESKGTLKQIGRPTVHDKMIELQEAMDQLTTMTSDLEAQIGYHADNAKAVAGLERRG